MRLHKKPVLPFGVQVDSAQAFFSGVVGHLLMVKLTRRSVIRVTPTQKAIQGLSWDENAGSGLIDGHDHVGGLSFGRLTTYNWLTLACLNLSAKSDSMITMWITCSSNVRLRHRHTSGLGP